MHFLDNLYKNIYDIVLLWIGGKFIKLSLFHIVLQIKITCVIVEISRRLTYNTKPVLEKDVPKVLRTICDEDNFRQTEFSPSKVRAACKQLLSKLLTFFFKYMFIQKTVHQHFIGNIQLRFVPYQENKEWDIYIVLVLY